MPFRAIGFRALVKPKEVETVSKGGIALALDERLEMNAQVMGTIVELGPDFARDFKPSHPAWGLQKGDLVVYAKYAGKWVKDPRTGEESLYINDEDVVGKYEDEVANADSAVVASQET